MPSLTSLHRCPDYGHTVYGYRNQDIGAGWLEMALFFSHNWRLPALFMISGVGTWFLLRHGRHGYLQNRVVRLGLPLVVGMLIWNAPYGYLQHMARGGEQSLTQFYVDWLANFRTGHARHLWFLMNLLVYSFMFVLLVPALKRLGKLSLPAFAVILFLFAFLIDSFLKPLSYQRPFDYRDFWYVPFFLAGFVAMEQPRVFWEQLRAARWWLLAAGILLSFSFMGIYPLVAPDQASLLANGGWLESQWGFASPVTILHGIAYSANAVLWCGILFAFTFHHLNWNSRMLGTLNRAVYPVYIFHFPIMMAGLYALRNIAWPWQIEWALLTVGTFILSGTAYWIMDRGRIAPILIGLKSNRRIKIFRSG